MTWRDLINQVGPGKVAKAMKADLPTVKFPTVYRLSKPGATGFPSNGKGGIMKPLCSAMHRLLSAEDFIVFMNSLSSEITGFGTGRPSIQPTGTEG